MAEWVLDASAILAFLRKEPGRETVAPLLSEAAISANNLAEVSSRLLDHGLRADEVQALIERLSLPVHSVDEAMAFEIGALRPLTRARGSTGQRAKLSRWHRYWPMAPASASAARTASAAPSRSATWRCTIRPAAPGT